MNRQHWCMGIITAVFVAGCGSDDEPAAASMENQRPVDASPAPVEEASSVGSVSFSLDGRAVQFDSAANEENNYTKYVTFIAARPSAGSTEVLNISFNSIDLRKIEFPADLPLPKDFSKPIDASSAMATVSYYYINGNGDEWTGSGSARVESYDSAGTLTGSFDGVSVSPINQTLENKMLSAGRFEVQISRPW